MRAIPRTLMATALGAALALVPPPVGAQEGSAATVPRAEAQAATLRASLFGQEAIISAADTVADSAPSGSAEGTGALLGATGFGQSEADADASTPAAGSPDPVCSDLSLPADIPLPAGVITACSTASATAAGGQGSATASGLAADIELGTSDDLEELGLPPLDEVIPVDELDTLDPVLDPIFALLPPGTLPADPDVIKTGLAAALSGDVTVARIRAGATESTSTASMGAASATSTSDGVIVDLLITALGPLVTVEIGGSSATATFADGAATAEHVLAPVTITPGLALVVAGLPSAPAIPVPEGQTIDLPLPPPLQSRITVSAGEDTVDGVSAGATASAVRLDLFTGLPEGGVVIAASETSAAVEGAIVEPAPPTAPAPDVEVEPVESVGPSRRAALPRTGGDGRWIPIGVLLAVGAAVALLTLRRHRSLPEA